VYPLLGCQRDAIFELLDALLIGQIARRYNCDGPGTAIVTSSMTS
jgi:hypothetical protein